MKKFSAQLKVSIAALCLSAVSFEAFATGPGVSTAHDQLAAPTTGASSTHEQWNPKLHTEDGCRPYAPVDDAGNYNAGLQDSGSSNGGCTAAPSGITIARGVCKSGYCATMYVYYMPKDTGLPFPSVGHRHDFEEIVVWRQNGNFIGASYSAHGDYNYHTNPHMSDGRVNPAYDYDGFTHAMTTINNDDRNKGTVWPVKSWGKLTSAAKQALNDTSNFPTSVFPARDDNFICKINESRLPGIVNSVEFSGCNQ